MNDFTRRGFLGVLTAATAMLPLRKAKAVSVETITPSKPEFDSEYVLEFRTGMMPQDVYAKDSGKLLCSMPAKFNTAVFGAIEITSEVGIVDVAGYVGYGRVKRTSDGAVMFQAECKWGEGPHFRFNQLHWIPGDPIRVSGCVYFDKHMKLVTELNGEAFT